MNHFVHHYWNDCGVSVGAEHSEHNYAASVIFEMDEINYFVITKNDDSSQSQDDSSFTYSEREDGSIIIHMDEINTYGDISDDNCSLSSNDSELDEEKNLTDEILDDIEMIVTACTSKGSHEELDTISKRALERTMNSTQEVWNAVTMLIAPCYCLYYILSGSWLSSTSIEVYRFNVNLDLLSGSVGCIKSSIFPNLHALPPVTVIAIVSGMVLHAPASIIYHLLCAFKIPQGAERINHWARRLDQAMIHVISILWSYGSSSNWKYTLLSMMFNGDSIYGLYKRPFCPKIIVRRFAFALIIQSMPLFTLADGMLSVKLLFIFAAGGWLFARYPLGGYSHGMFHIVIALAPPLVLSASIKLPSVEEQIRFAAVCALSKER